MGQIPVEAPPALEADEGAAGVLAGAVPMLGSLGSVALVATLATGGGRRSLLAAAAFLLGTLAFVLVQLDRQRVRRLRRRDAARRGYLRHLAGIRARLRGAADDQRAGLSRLHPSPSALLSVVARDPPSDTGPADAEALLVRYGVGDRPAAVVAEPAATHGSDESDPAARDALRRLLAAHTHVPDVPLTVDLRATDRIAVVGDAVAARDLTRSLVLQAAAAHPPDRLRVALAAGDEASRDWDWLKWLPHADGRGADDTHLLLVVDGADAPAATGRRTVLDLAPGAVGGVSLRLGDDRTVSAEVADAVPVSGLADRCDVGTAEAVARRLLARHPRVAADAGSSADLAALLGIADPATVDPRHQWRAGPGPPRLRAPLGVTEGGSPLHLDLEEAARGGQGPHGLVVGATGSGKSELLRTLVLGLALTHPPDRLNLVLVDFKGGATFAGLAPLPHVAGSVTNLADDLALVDRMQDALAGELVRRQEVLRAAGLASVHDAGSTLPRLLVVVDEFAEMLVARPELLDTFTAIGRLGRSLGLHLLLASQRLEEGRLRGLESHLSYRIGLRTFSAAESRAVLGVPDAAELPPQPGSGLLRTGPGEPVRFRAAYVSGPGRSAPVPPRRRLAPFTMAGPGPRDTSEPPTPAGGPSVVDLVVGRLAGHGSARPVWVPPLDRPAVLGDLLGPLRVDPHLGLVSPAGRRTPLRLPLGLVDRPRDQRRDPYVVDLDGAGGHLAVVGAPRSGRTTLLQTLVAALALTHTPREAQVMVLDLAGGGLAPLTGLPHVSVVARRDEPDVVRRVVARVTGLLDRREEWWRDHGVGDLAAYRRLLRAGAPGDPVPGDGYGEVFLVVDGWADLRSDHDDLELPLQRLASRGLALGVHLVVATGRWADLRAATRDLVATRVELRLGDPLDSEVDRRAARGVPRDRPGRGLTAGGHHLLTALPRLDDVVSRIARAWPGSPARPVGRVPSEVRLDDVRAVAPGADDCVLLGVDDHRAIGFDPAAEPLLLVLGGRGSGRTTTLRTLVAELVRLHDPARAQLVVVDPRRGLLDDVPPDHLLAHHASAAAAQPALTEVADHLRGRLPGPTVTTAQMEGRSWWSGAEVHVLVDDHELLSGGGSPLAPLLPLLPHAADVGLHLVVCRRTSGAARALHEPDLRALRELGAPTLLLPGDPDEGPLVGRLGARPGPPGRGRLITSGGEVTELQVAR